MPNLYERVKKVLEKVRPSLQADGGDVELSGVDEEKGIVRVRLQGSCTHCPMVQLTLKGGIEALLKKEIKEIKEVIAE